MTDAEYRECLEWLLRDPRPLTIRQLNHGVPISPFYASLIRQW